MVDADLEGIVAKHLADAYQPKHTRWQKILNKDYFAASRPCRMVSRAPGMLSGRAVSVTGGPNCANARSRGWPFRTRFVKLRIDQISPEYVADGHIPPMRQNAII